MRRIPILIFVVTVLVTGPGLVRAAEGEAQQKQKSLPGGVILNQAADAIVGYMRTEKPIEAGATKQMVLAGLNQVVDQYVGTQVSHLFFNVCYQRACYRSAVWQSYWDVAKPETDVTGWPRRYWLIHKLGIDPFTVRVNGVECASLADLPKPAQPQPAPKQPSREVWSVAEVAPRVAQFEVPMSAVKRGFNTIEIQVSQGGDQRVIWLEVYVVP